MTAPTDHLAAARAALDCAMGAAARPIVADRHLARAQVHATLALAEEARTANLIRALDYGMVGPADLAPDERRAEITKRLWATSDAHPPVDEADVETLAGLLWEYTQNASGPGDSFDETNEGERNRFRNRARRLLATGKVEVTK